MKRWEAIFRKQDQKLRVLYNTKEMLVVGYGWVPGPAEFKLLISLQGEGPSPGVILGT